MDFFIPDEVFSRQTMVVEKAHTAHEIGSGSVQVLATPMMIALMEAAAVDAVQKYLPDGWTTVGTHVNVEHLRASPLGELVTAEATLLGREGRVLSFAVTAADSAGIVGQGHHKRFVVDLEAFMEKLRSRGS
ncbi:MAG: thioesterase family protein [Candidatus Aminicenantes bacterium]|jgi:predicted thioesterase